ncbi:MULTISPECIES: glycoside hydrolase family 3 N-terminal domain-containing protein [Flavobacteriaceae]|uniref:beta-N-acetylhexosaminidase n=2 Tax=Flavobacteriaceae TaxID=49546 RepID=A0A4Y8AUD2_9FLAO|nr:MULTISPECIES: glycoside hydrolase family 3 N-terminal domain-containing protein [Flavobacteriaceae]TEW75093.1 beta-N-acetylglucosaminidase [Gramella jeungdoensis]GGK41663.1 beta-N-acetylglucosaminidase [Lutibacter litoralis]
MKKIIILSLFLLLIKSYGQQIDPLLTTDLENQEKWVENTMNKLSLDEKIGQLFMIQAYSNKDRKHKAYIKKMIKKYHVGGLIFMQGTPEKQAELTNYYQSTSNIPLLIGFDGEWGLNMRLKNSFRYPWNMTLGAVRNNKLIEQFGERLGEHCKRIGIHINFAPVVDINTNPENPIIGNRSFGENKYNVTEKSIAFTNGMQRRGVLANAKHFPGHGDTSTDSHKTLPFLDFSIERLDSIELFPYKELFKTNLASVMVAHLNVPALEPKTGLPTSISYKVITELLKEKMGYNGLIFTDALNMKGAANYAKPGDIDLAAFLAGNDMLLIPEDVKAAVKKIKRALKNNLFTEKRLDESVRKILKAKYWVGLNNFEPINKIGIQDDIITVKDQLLYNTLMKDAITLVQNKKAIVPIKELTNNKIAYVKLGDSDNVDFTTTLKKYTQVDVISEENLSVLLQKLKPYTTVIIGYHKSNETPWKSFKMSEKELTWLKEISKNNKVILDVFASPYTLLDIQDFNHIEAVLVSYQNSKASQEISAQMIFGAIEIKGKLPVSINHAFPEGTGITTSNLMRLSYTIPEDVDMDSKLLSKIDSLTTMVVDSTMAPGGQVLVARYGKVVYHKSFGYHTYDKKQPVKLTDLYDLASVTKILGGLPMIMKSEEMGLFNLENTLGELLPYLKGSNKDTITITEALSHVGKIKPWIPYYLETVDSISKVPYNNLYRTIRSDEFSIKVAENLFLINSYTDSIYKKIAEAPQRKTEGYRYSGLLFYLFKKYIKDTFHKEMNELNHENFYLPLGATSLGYNPLEKFNATEIAPTEIDDYYRHQILRGDVHDMGAGMMNGVSGNAGLFSNSNDVAKMMQMYLQKGFYGGKRYFESKTIDKFNHRYYEKDSIRRGLGFDKPSLDPEIKASSKYASANSFGHSGFTGTFAWADPDNGLLYVFLSNRVYPVMSNNKLIEKDIRSEIHNLIYQAVH